MFSMLSMDSQDSQEDLIREGVDVTENIFHTCVGNFQRRLDNNTVWKCRNITKVINMEINMHISGQ